MRSCIVSQIICREFDFILRLNPNIFSLHTVSVQSKNIHILSLFIVYEAAMTDKKNSPQDKDELLLLFLKVDFSQLYFTNYCTVCYCVSLCILHTDYSQWTGAPVKTSATK